MFSLQRRPLMCIPIARSEAGLRLACNPTRTTQTTILTQIRIRTLQTLRRRGRVPQHQHQPTRSAMPPTLMCQYCHR